jgi:NAD(P)-dependent dehydrogenase (short-subunit alcohol dehydrogenase family)
MGSLQGKCVVVVGRGGGIAKAVTMLARSEGARVVVAARDSEVLAAGYDDDVTAETVDVTDDTSISAFAERVGPVDHLVSTVSARARGKLAELDRAKLQLSFDTKVIGPAMLAKYFAPQINEGGSIALFSGVNAFKVNVGYLGVAITNGAVDFLTRSLAVELAPIRVNAISPESSIPAHGIRLARTASASTLRISATPIPPDGSAPSMTSPKRCCSRSPTHS